MNKPKTAKLRAEKITTAASQAAQPAAAAQTSRTIRETVESVVIAFVLAFLFRTFEAEAFVIPTGSMAPTLQGRHKDLACDKCGYRIRANASSEVNEEGYRKEDVIDVVCPLCRHEMSVNPNVADNKEKYPSYNGDRIIVAKFPYEFVDPKRWDIVVFKYPGDAKVNYIKRLVGLPGETVHIEHGDIFTRKAGEELKIQRKPPEKQLAMAQIVYDNDYVVDAMTKNGWPVRWQELPMPASAKDTRWTASEDGKTFETSATGAGPAWLRYQHFVPSGDDWGLLEQGPLPKNFKAAPQLITDFYAYDNSISEPVGSRSEGHGEVGAAALGLHWVGDLMLDCKLELSNVDSQSAGRVLLDLVKGGKHFRATINPEDGNVELSIDGVADYHPKAKTSIVGNGTYHVVFANFDHELSLWINGSPVKFSTSTAYGPLDNNVPQSTPADPGDLAPAGIGVDGSLKLHVSHLRLLRDIYYVADKNEGQQGDPIADYSDRSFSRSRQSEFVKFLSTPDEWKGTTGYDRGPFALRKSVEFPLAEDQFFVLGDNSPASSDSRMWRGQNYVDRELMIGKALFIYWPHGLYEIPGLGIPFPGGMFPNVRDMGFVR